MNVISNMCLLVICMFVIVFSNGCSKELENAGYFYYISDYLELKDPINGTIERIPHNDNEKIVVRMQHDNKEIAVFDPQQGIKLFLYSDYDYSEGEFCDSLSRIEHYRIDDENEMFVCYRVQNPGLSQPFIVFVQKGQEVDCNELTFFYISDAF